jgi:hypothetical protein
MIAIRLIAKRRTLGHRNNDMEEPEVRESIKRDVTVN